MNPRGRPFEPGNKMGRGRPQGSRNKSKAVVQKLLEQSEIPVVLLIIRQALQGDYRSQRLLMSVYPNLPRKRSCRLRVGKIQSVEDLMSATEQTTQQMSRGEITPEEGNATMKGLEQMGHLLEQQIKVQKSQPRPKTPLPEFMRLGLEEARADRLQRDAKAKQEKESLETNRSKPP